MAAEIKKLTEPMRLVKSLPDYITAPEPVVEEEEVKSTIETDRIPEQEEVLPEPEPIIIEVEIDPPVEEPEEVYDLTNRQVSSLLRGQYVQEMRFKDRPTDKGKFLTAVS